MKIFINEKTVEIVGLEASVDKSKYDVCIASEEEIISKVLIGNVLIVEANAKHIQRLLKLLEIKKLKKQPTVNELSPVFSDPTSIQNKVPTKNPIPA